MWGLPQVEVSVSGGCGVWEVHIWELWDVYRFKFDIGLIMIMV